MNDSEQIKSWAREIGFDKVGIAPAGPAPGGEQLTAWLRREFHAKMKWMMNNTDRRLDPRRVLSGAQSIICLAVNYYTPYERDPGELKISRYAWGTDYHHILGKMLKQLVARLADEWPDSANLWYVDTAPILEKAWAQRAGLGWIGKNDVLISRDFGTWLFLGEIITTLKLQLDLPEQDFCGTCTRCLEACPTGAIVEPYVVDAGRCISYWTIESRGEFPLGVAHTLDGWVFGCDVCQDVCPFNRFQKNTSREEDFGPRKALLQADGWREIGDREFTERTAGSPLRRTGLGGLRRNLQATDRNRSLK